MLWLKLKVSDGAPLALETYRAQIDALRGFPISPDPFDQHFADIVPNLVQAAQMRIDAALANGDDPAQADVDLVTSPTAPAPAWGMNIADTWPLVEDPTQTPTPWELQDRVPFPPGAETFDFDTTNAEWVVQVTGP